jgi:hypothetical protein
MEEMKPVRKKKLALGVSRGIKAFLGWIDR